MTAALGVFLAVDSSSSMLGQTLAAAKAALEEAESGEDTRIDLGLLEAIALLDAQRRPSGAVQVIILLSDGRHDANHADAARASSGSAGTRRYEVHTIGLREPARPRRRLMPDLA